MSTTRNTRAALSNITNIADDGRRTREEKNLHLRNRRSQMSEEKKEEARRKQREYQRRYREKKNAESQNSSTSYALTISGTNDSGMQQSTSSIVLDKENLQPWDDGHIPTATATHIGSAQSVHSEILNTPTNARSAQPRKRKAEITDEQIEENKRRNREYQRQWRARKKAKLQNNSTTIVVNQASADMGDPVSLTADEVQTGLSTIIEIEDDKEEPDWLHRNDDYVPCPRGPRTVLTAQMILTTSGGSEVHIPGQRSNLASVPNNEDETDCGLFEPTTGGDECDMEEAHVLNNDNFVNEGHVYESYRVFPEGLAANNDTNADPYDFIYENLPPRHRLRRVADCSYCGAIRFQYETPGFCCKKGKVQIHIPEVPNELKRLFTSQVDDDAKYFRKRIRYINLHFAFVSLGVTTDDRYKSPAGTGIYNFRVHGALYHRLEHLIPGDPDGRRHLQLYFYDPDGKCRFEYPRQFCEATQQGNDSYPKYRRRDDGRRVKIRRAELDNRWVVPYNPGLLFKYNCHINVEACSSIKAVKYLFKYVYKGHDQAEISVNAEQNNGCDGVINEIQQYRNARYISPPEAVYRILGFPLFGVYPAVLQLMIERFPGEEKVYHSFDTIVDDPNNAFPMDFLNSITPNGLPPHELKLKINCPVILLRNLDPNNGLCNGTRLMVRALQDNAIDAEIVGGQHAGKRVFIPRLPLSPSDDISLPFRFKRKQFPVRLSFAMTINKSQGQTIPNVGIYLPEPVFSHGQLYVGLSRGVSRSTTRVLAKPREDLDPTGKCTKNIVYRDVLNW